MIPILAAITGGGGAAASGAGLSSSQIIGAAKSVATADNNNRSGPATTSSTPRPLMIKKGGTLKLQSGGMFSVNTAYNANSFNNLDAFNANTSNINAFGNSQAQSMQYGSNYMDTAKQYGAIPPPVKQLDTPTVQGLSSQPVNNSLPEGADPTSRGGSKFDVSKVSKLDPFIGTATTIAQGFTDAMLAKSADKIRKENGTTTQVSGDATLGQVSTGKVDIGRDESSYDDSGEAIKATGKSLMKVAPAAGAVLSAVGFVSDGIDAIQQKRVAEKTADDNDFGVEVAHGKGLLNLRGKKDDKKRYTKQLSTAISQDSRQKNAENAANMFSKDGGVLVPRKNLGILRRR